MYESIKELLNISWDIKLWEYAMVIFFANILMIAFAMGSNN